MKHLIRTALHIILMLSMMIAPPTIAQTKVFFSPGGKITRKLMAHIANANTRVFAAVYMLTEKRIALALINAHQRGVDVQVVLDPISTTSQYGKAPLMGDAGVPLFCHHPQKKGWMSPALMHNKFAIIDDKVWTGSFNWTRSADQRNKENVVVIDEEDVTEQFLAEFDLLKTESYTWPPKLYTSDDVGMETTTPTS